MENKKNNRMEYILYLFMRFTSLIIMTISIYYIVFDTKYILAFIMMILSMIYSFESTELYKKEYRVESSGIKNIFSNILGFSVSLSIGIESLFILNRFILGNEEIKLIYIFVTLLILMLSSITYIYLHKDHFKKILA